MLLISKTYEEFVLQHNFLDVFCRRSQHSVMPTPPEKENTSAQHNIEDVMSADERHDTGLSKLSHVELQKLNAWLEMNIGKLARSRGGLAPGPIHE